MDPIAFGHVIAIWKVQIIRKPVVYSPRPDRTNGRAYATVLRQSVVCRRRLWRYILWLNGVS